MSASSIIAVMVRFLGGAGPTRAQAIRRIRGGILGIALSLVPLVLVFEIAGGMIEGISQRFIETWTAHYQVISARPYASSELETRAKSLEHSGLAAHAMPEIQGMGLLRGGRSSFGVTIRSVSPRLWKEDEGFRRYMMLKAGSFTVDADQDMVVGIALAEKLSLSVGQRVRLLTYRSDAWSGLPKVSTFVIRGIVGTGYQELDRSWVFINLDRGTRVIDPSSARTLINLKILDPFQIPNPMSYRGPRIDVPNGKSYEDFDTYRDTVTKALGQEWFGYSWFDQQQDQFQHFIGTKNLLLFVVFLIVLVASVNVSSTMILLVVEKQFEIAMLKVSGARPRDMGLLFLGMGAIIGTIGALIGVGVGAVLSLFVNELIIGIEYVVNFFAMVPWFITHGFSTSGYQGLQLLNPEFYLERIPVRLVPGDLLGMIGLTSALSILASWIPASRAARLKPADLFRRV